MFVLKKDQLLESITRFQRSVCCYGWFIEDETAPPPMCDCKYGAMRLSPASGEKTGCPELRCIVELLSGLTDKQYSEIMIKKRKNTFI